MVFEVLAPPTMQMKGKSLTSLLGVLRKYAVICSRALAMTLAWEVYGALWPLFDSLECLVGLLDHL